MADDDEQGDENQRLSVPAPGPVRRGPGRRFEPGNTFGKKGRTKGSARAKKKLVKASPEMADELVHLALHARSENVRAKACKDGLELAGVFPRQAEAPGLGAGGGQGSADAALASLWAAVRAKQGPPSSEAQEAGQVENASPGAGGEPGQGLPS